MSEPAGPRQYRRREVLTDIDWNDWEVSFVLEHGWNTVFILFLGFALSFKKGKSIPASELMLDHAKAKLAFLRFGDDKVVCLADFLNDPALWPVGTALITQANKGRLPAQGVLHTDSGFVRIEQQQIQFAWTRIKLDADAQLIEHVPDYHLIGYLDGNYLEIKADYDQWIAEKNPPEPLLVANYSPVEWFEKGHRPMCGPAVSIHNIDEWQRLVAATEQCGEDDILEVKQSVFIYGISSVGVEIKAMPQYRDKDPKLGGRSTNLRSLRRRRKHKKPPDDLN